MGNWENEAAEEVFQKKEENEYAKLRQVSRLNRFVPAAQTAFPHLKTCVRKDPTECQKFSSNRI